MEADKDLQQIKKRLVELARRSYDHNVYTFTPFWDCPSNRLIMKSAPSYPTRELRWMAVVRCVSAR